MVMSFARPQAGRARLRVLATLWLLTILAVLPGCPGGERHPRLDGPTLSAPPIRTFESTLDDPLALALPYDMEVLEGRVYVTEAGNHRVTVTDDAFALLHRLGREGEGPGELRFPKAVKAAGGDRIQIVEIGNARVSVFDTAGRFIRIVPRLLPTVDAALLGDTLLLAPGVGGDFPGLMAESGSEPEPYSRDPVDRAGENSPLVDELFVMPTAAGSRIVLSRPVAGRLEVYDSLGRLERIDTLPEEIVAPVEAANREFREQLEREGHEMLTRKLMEGAHPTDDGRLVIRMRLSNPFAVLYDPLTGGMQALYLDPASDAGEILRASESLDIEDGELYALARDNLYVFELPAEARR